MLSWGQAKICKGPQPTGTEVSTRAPGWSEAKWLPWGRSQQRDKEQRGRHDGTCVLLATALQFLQGVPHTPPGTPAKAPPAPGYSQFGRLSDNPELPSPWHSWRWGWTPRRGSGPTPRPTAGEGAACEPAAVGLEAGRPGLKPQLCRR